MKVCNTLHWMCEWLHDTFVFVPHNLTDDNDKTKRQDSGLVWGFWNVISIWRVFFPPPRGPVCLHTHALLLTHINVHTPCNASQCELRLLCEAKNAAPAPLPLPAPKPLFLCCAVLCCSPPPFFNRHTHKTTTTQKSVCLTQSVYLRVRQGV